MTLLEVVVTALIQAVGQVFQAADSTPVLSSTMEASGTGGLLQRLVLLDLGSVNCSATTPMSSETTACRTTAPQLVASGIKNLYLSDAVALS